MKTRKVIEGVFELGYTQGYAACEDTINADRNRLAGDLADLQNKLNAALKDKEKFELLWKQEQERNAKLSIEVQKGDEMQRVISTELSDLRKYHERAEHGKEARGDYFVKMRDALDVSMEKGTISLTEVRDMFDKFEHNHL